MPVAELDGLGVELEKLSELESIKEEWQLQAEAQDEVGVCVLRPPPWVLPHLLRCCCRAVLRCCAGGEAAPQSPSHAASVVKSSSFGWFCPSYQFQQSESKKQEATGNPVAET